MSRDKETHPIYQDNNVKKVISYYRRNIAPEVDPELTTKLENRIDEILMSVANLYDKVMESRTLGEEYKKLRTEHMAEDRKRFIEREYKNKENLTGLRRLYVEVYKHIAKEIFYKEELGDRLFDQLRTISSKASNRVMKDIERQPIKWKDKLEESITITEIDRKMRQDAGRSPSEVTAKELLSKTKGGGALGQ